MKKIVIVTPSLGDGGAERVAVNLANWLVNRRYFDVHLVAFFSVDDYKHDLHHNVRLHQLGVGRSLFALLPLVKTLRVLAPEVILSSTLDTNIVTGIASFFVKHKKLLFRETNPHNIQKTFGLIRRLKYKVLMLASYSRCNHVIANSSDTAKSLIKLRVVKKEKIHVIGNPVLPPDYAHRLREPADHRWLDDPEIKVVVTAGRLHYQKNHLLLVRAFAHVIREVPMARLIILGRGPEGAAIDSEISALELRECVELVGFKKNPLPYLSRSSLFVLTSRWEGFGNVVVEALAAGLFVIATECDGGVKDILEGGDYGITVPNYNADALARAIIESLSEDKKYDRSRLPSRANEYSVEKISERYLELLQ